MLKSSRTNQNWKSLFRICLIKWLDFGDWEWEIISTYSQYIFSRWMVAPSKRLLVLNIYWSGSSPHTSSWTHINYLSIKMLKTYVDFLYRSRKYLLPCLMFTKDNSNWKWRLSTISGIELHNPQFPVLNEFKSVCTDFWVRNHFQRYNHFLLRLPLLIHYRYFHVKCSNDLYRFIPLLQTFTAMTLCVMYNGSNQTHRSVFHW